MSEEMQVRKLTFYLPDGKEVHIPGDAITHMQGLASGLPMVTWKQPDGSFSRMGGLPFRFDLEEPSLIKPASGGIPKGLKLS